MSEQIIAKWCGGPTCEGLWVWGDDAYKVVRMEEGALWVEDGDGSSMGLWPGRWYGPIPGDEQF